MAALFVISIICIHSTLTDAVNLSVLLSHKTAAGSLVAKLPWQTGQKSQILDSRGSELFHIQSGEVITVSDISKVVHETLPLVVKHELGTDQWLDSLHVKITPSTNSADHELFSKTEYEGFVKENESPGTVVQGLEDLFKRSVSYKLASGGFGLFKIVRRHQNDGETPVIVTTQLIDRESHSQYTLVIEAHNGTHFDETAVYITIGDDNDNNPSFRSRTYAVTVDYADVIHKSRILSIQAHDADIDTVHYKLSPNDVFDVDDNGDIFAKSPTEVQSRQYLLELVAVDSAGHSSIPASIALTVSSDLKFVTKHSRVRRQAQTDDSATVTEAADILYTFNAAQWSTPRYSITNVSVESVKNLIRISDNSLRLRPGRKLDYEKEEQRSISVVVNITDGGNLVEIRTIQITVTNVNDEPPYFITKPDNFLATVLPTTSEGTLVFTVVAKDDDAELAKVEYFLVSGGNNRFQVNANNGEITVVGSTTFQINHKYYVLVEARDVNSNPVQKTQRTVEILVGEREPQIFKSSYVVDVPENTRIPFIVETVKARRFQDAPLRYTLLDNLGQTPSAFTITSDGPQGGEVRLVQTLDYEDPEQPKEYNLRVVVSEQSPSGLSSSVSLLISVTDMNDHDPNFPISTYVKRQVREDTDINVALLNVTASDADSGRNAELTFSVLHPLFAADTIGNSGIIKVNGRLDYDRTASHVYEFQVVATDHGDSPRSGSATVSVWVTNVNDEDPEFSTNLKAEVFENANKDQFVHTVHVTDPDGDNVEVYFKTDSGESETSGPFQITPQTGRVFLREQLPSGQFHYVLNLTAVDDGSCCTTSSPRRRSEAALIVEIVDVNDNRPEFPDCQNYNTNPPSVKENSEIGSRVFQVSANDLDTGENGRIRYKFISTGIITKFNIDAETGIITVAESIDREAANGARDLGITVEAIDHGVPRLNNVCSFRILVEDVNDNPPIFTQQTYTPSIEEKSKIDTSVIRLVANDLDSGENRRVEYSLIENPDDLFKINNETGILRLATNLGGLSDLRALMVMAQDHGKPNRLNTTAIVNVRVTQNLVPPPIFIGDVANNIPIYVNETHKVGYQFPITTIRANATGNRDVNFLFINDRQIPVSILGPFAIRRPPGQREVMQIYLRSRLDFEQTESYELKIRAAVESSNSDIIVKIMVIDQNDEQPAFIGYNPQALTINGSLTENRTVGQTVVTLQAQDLDKSANFRNLRFSFYEDRTGDVASNFTINPDTGLITTRTDFDLESFLPQGIIRFTVKVDDRVQSADEASCKGCPNSATAVVEVLILDVNDNKPKFEKAIWEASVFEDVDIGHPVLTLSASDLDKDSQMFYSIESGGNDFTVERRSGIIRVANLLDFENKNRRFYNLTVQVYDGKYIDKANVEIQVLDANDNAPEFPPGPYDVRNIVEESLAVTKIVTVNATDPDTERPNKIEYSLNGPLADDGTFSIDRTTGEITLHRPLDRDKPDGQVVYEFNVLAVDEPDHPETKRTGVSYVRVFPIDINDNNPKFDQNAISGSVLEHTIAGSLGGSQVFAVNAVDNDFGENARVEYTLVNQPQHNGLNIFGIDRTSGQISVITQDPNVLDRETQAEYTLTVRATDKGPNPTPVDQDIKINLDDKNDQWPVFSQTIYKVTMSENLPKGASVTSVTASDKDIGINAQLIYSLDSNKDIGYFYIDTRNATNEGILRVFESSKIDYEDPSLRFFNVTVNVDDVPNPSHKVTAYIEVTVQDFNDNKPVFTRDTIPKEVYEDIPVGTVLATFSADDIDEGLNAEFVYSIDHGSDPKRQFRVNSSGVVTLNKPLDREQDELHNVIVLAIDKGTPPQTGSATLMLRVLDINDNAPDFLEDYVVYFKENVETVQKWKGVILATDPDTAVNGPPFTFALPCDWNCPCEFFQNCDKFNMSFGRNEQYPDGFATVSTRARLFDREQTKEYYMPIVMWDSGDPVMTATRSLHIVIRDENDNHHEAALKKILVYSYDGFRALQDVEIGRVYAKDPDDWDVVDKEFTVVKEISPHFSVVKTSGMILMSGKPEEGTYKFIVAVFDRKFEEMVNSEVEITVKKIPTAAVYSSGSIRLNGITARDFVERAHKEGGKFGEYEQSKYDKMRTELAKKLNVPEANVEIFSVRDGDGVTDVRFAAHGSPWYKSSKLDGLIARNKEEFEQNVGVTVGMVPIDECLYEICDHGCYNKYVVSDVPRVIAGNSTSFVGVDAYLEQACNTCDGPSGSDCTCKAGEFPTECRSDFCYNGGTCYIDDWKEMRCKCEEDFDGARCQQTKHSFKGNGYALYPALAQCEHGLTSLEFITSRSNCLIFYNGPMDTDLGVQDHISLQLRSGSPVLTIDHGTGTLELTLGNKKLADGQWHRLDISSAGKVITLTVDNCDTAVVTENETMSSEDRTSCEKSGTTPGENGFLNVNTLLQMGGTYADPPSQFLTPGLNDFDGCIKNFRHLGLLYDLYMGNTGLQEGTFDGCPQEEKSCGSVNDINGLVCGQNGICVGNLEVGAPTCICKPGWMGKKCETETPTKDFGKESYMVWQLRMATESSRNRVQLKFRSRDKDGVLFSVMSSSRTEYLNLQIRDYMLQAIFHSEKPLILTLDKVNASNGHWHTAYLERRGKRMKLYMDGGEGPYYIDSQGLTRGRRVLEIAPDNVFGGAVVSGNIIQNPTLNDYESSCMTDVRLDGNLFPMDKSTGSNAAVLTLAKNIENGCTRDDCTNNTKCHGQNIVCVPLWEGYDCRCEVGYAPDPQGNCLGLCRCENGGKCEYDNKYELGYYCICQREFTGLHCETAVSLLVEAQLSDESLAAILVCAFLLLVMLLAVFLYLKLRKPKEKMMLDDDPYDDIRENIVNYDEDGAGEEDQNAFDFSRIRVPVDGTLPTKVPFENTPRRVDRPLQSSMQPGEAPPDVGNFIHGRLKDADDDLGAPPHDSVREFADEGGGSDAGSLSSLNTSTSSGDQDYDYLNDWGPKFAKLADMYGAGQGDED